MLPFKGNDPHRPLRPQPRGEGQPAPGRGFEKLRDEGLEEDTIATLLQEEGYRTALFGKYLNGYGKEDPAHVPPGWDEWHVKLDKQKAYRYRINENGEVVSYGKEAGDYYTDILSGQATEYVRNAASDPQPFFLHLTTTVPHMPATPTERHEDASRTRRPPAPRREHRPRFRRRSLRDRRALPEALGEHAGRRRDGRRPRRRARGSRRARRHLLLHLGQWVLQGEHRVVQGKSRPYEESANVPLFVRGPGIAAGSEIKEMVLNTDLAPTFAELAGLEDFPAADGRSLAPLLRGGDPPSWRKAVLLEAEGFSEEEAGSRAAYEAIRTGTHKYVEYGNGEKELYDLEADPYELESLHEIADPSLLGDLKARLDALRSCTGDECREAEDTR